MSPPHRIFESYDVVHTIMEILSELGFAQKFEFETSHRVISDGQADDLRNMRNVFFNLRLVNSTFNDAGRGFLFRFLKIRLVSESEGNGAIATSIRRYHDLFAGSAASGIKVITLDFGNHLRSYTLTEEVLKGINTFATIVSDFDPDKSITHQWIADSCRSLTQLSGVQIRASPEQLPGQLQMVVELRKPLTELGLYFVAGNPIRLWHWNRLDGPWVRDLGEVDSLDIVVGNQDLQNLLGKLKIFRLYLPLCHASRQGDMAFSFQVRIQAMLDAASEVESFDLGGWWLLSRQRHLRLPCTSLRSLRLKDTCMTSCDLGKVLDRNQLTLKYLGVAVVALTEGYWESILTTILDMLPNLHTLELSRLQYENEAIGNALGLRGSEKWNNLPVRSLRPKDRTAWLDLLSAVAVVRYSDGSGKSNKAPSISNQVVLRTENVTGPENPALKTGTICSGLSARSSRYRTLRCKITRPFLPGEREMEGTWLCKFHEDQIPDLEYWPWGNDSAASHTTGP